MKVLANLGPLAGKGPQEMMGFLGLQVSLVSQDALEVMDSQGEMEHQDFKVITWHGDHVEMSYLQ